MPSNQLPPSTRNSASYGFATILSTGAFVPETKMTNQDIIEQYNLMATDRAVQHITGAKERRWVKQGIYSSDLLAQAAQQCLTRANVSVDQLDRIIYARLLGDGLIPATSARLLEKLQATVSIPAFDITAACSGFIHALDMGVRCIDSGEDYVLVLAGGIFSKSINQANKQNTRTVFLLGDGAAGVLLGTSSKRQFFASYIYTDSTMYELSYIPYGASMLAENRHIDNDAFDMQMPDGKKIHQSTIHSARIVSEKLFAQTRFSPQNLDIFITSDQTTQIWKDQLKYLNIPQHKSLSLFSRYGNTVAAMPPLILNEMLKEGKLKRGHLVLMMAHGAGASSGGLIFEY